MALTAASPGFVQGLKTFPRALGVLRRSPRLVRWLLYPLVLTAVLYGGALYFIIPRAASRIQQWSAAWLEPLGAAGQGLVLIAVFILALVLMATTFTMAYLLISGPFQESMSEEVEAVVNGEAAQSPQGAGAFLRGVWYGLRQALLLLPINIMMVFLGLIPVVGPVLALLWSGIMLGYTFLEVPANRRILPFRAKRGMAFRNLAATFGLGMPIALFALMPLAYVALLPVFVVAGTLLFLDIARSEEGARSSTP